MQRHDNFAHMKNHVDDVDTYREKSYDSLCFLAKSFAEAKTSQAKYQGFRAALELIKMDEEFPQVKFKKKGDPKALLREKILLDILQRSEVAFNDLQALVRTLDAEQADAATEQAACHAAVVMVRLINTEPANDEMRGKDAAENLKVLTKLSGFLRQLKKAFAKIQPAVGADEQAALKARFFERLLRQFSTILARKGLTMGQRSDPLWQVLQEHDDFRAYLLSRKDFDAKNQLARVLMSVKPEARKAAFKFSYQLVPSFEVIYFYASHFSHLEPTEATLTRVNEAFVDEVDADAAKIKQQLYKQLRRDLLRCDYDCNDPSEMARAYLNLLLKHPGFLEDCLKQPPTVHYNELPPERIAASLIWYSGDYATPRDQVGNAYKIALKLDPGCLRNEENLYYSTRELAKCQTAEEQLEAVRLVGLGLQRPDMIWCHSELQAWRASCVTQLLADKSPAVREAAFAYVPAVLDYLHKFTDQHFMKSYLRQPNAVDELLPSVFRASLNALKNLPSTLPQKANSQEMSAIQLNLSHLYLHLSDKVPMDASYRSRVFSCLTQALQCSSNQPLDLTDLVKSKALSGLGANPLPLQVAVESFHGWNGRQKNATCAAEKFLEILLRTVVSDYAAFAAEWTLRAVKAIPLDPSDSDQQVLLRMLDNCVNSQVILTQKARFELLRPIIQEIAERAPRVPNASMRAALLDRLGSIAVATPEQKGQVYIKEERRQALNSAEDTAGGFLMILNEAADLKGKNELDENNRKMFANALNGWFEKGYYKRDLRERVEFLRWANEYVRESEQGKRVFSLEVGEMLLTKIDQALRLLRAGDETYKLSLRQRGGDPKKLHLACQEILDNFPETGHPKLQAMAEAIREPNAKAKERKRCETKDQPLLKNMQLSDELPTPKAQSGFFARLFSRGAVATSAYQPLENKKPKVARRLV